MNNPNLFLGEPQKFRLVSNNICYGPMPEPDDEVEQRLTLNADGWVWFSAYRFGGDDDRSLLSRSNSFRIDKATAKRILSALATNFSGEYLTFDATDIGTWKLEFTNTDGVTYEYCGSLCAEIIVDGIDLSDMIRDTFGMNDLYVFDGNNKPDQIDRVSVEYRRVTKTKSGQPLPNGTEYVTWDYSEKLVVDRHTETLEHIQNVGSGCIISRKYYVQGGIDELLDYLDADELFGEILAEVDDALDNLLESKDYRITVDFKGGTQRVITGIYDKDGLPSCWDDFMDDIWNFTQFYGFGEIMNPAIYGKSRCRQSDYIYCSVEYGDGSNSYYYIADDDSFKIGDRVVVPAGKDNRFAVVKIVDKEYFAEENVPLPLSKTKHIIRKYDATVGNSDTNI